MTHQEVLELFDYDRWATERQLAAVEKINEDKYVKNLGSSHGGLRGTLVHMYAAEEIWFARWNGRSPSALTTEADIPAFGVLVDRWRTLQEDMRRFALGLREQGVSEVVEYRDTKGNPYSQPLEELIRHVINHATYHRGQITTMLRQVDVAPPVSIDLITYYRERTKEDS
jgi:uncharacterized damage-inducible protein DinB